MEAKPLFLRLLGVKTLPANPPFLVAGRVRVPIRFGGNLRVPILFGANLTVSRLARGESGCHFYLAAANSIRRQSDPPRASILH